MSTLKVIQIQHPSAASAALTLDSSGNLTTSGTLTFPAGSASSPSIQATGDPNTGLFFPAADTIAFAEGGTEVLRIDSSGRLGLGTTSPAYPLSILNATNNFVQFSKSGDAVAGSLIGRANVTDELRIQNSENAPIAFLTNNTERARIDSSGRLLVGADASYTGFNKTIELHNSGSGLDQPAYAVFSYPGTGATNAGRYHLYRSRGSSVGTNTIVANNDTLGYLIWHGANGTGYDTAAQIAAQVDGTPGASGDMPGRLVFSTCSDGSASPAERWRIDNAGSLVGVAGSAFVAPYIYNTTTASAANVHVTSGGFLQRSTSSLKYKENVQVATHGLTELLQLRPVTYTGKSETDGSTVFGGLIAEEVDAVGLSEFVQYAEDGSPDALAYGNMVSLCIKAIQEQQAVIEELQAKVAALEAS
jgi:hypothetical protein